MARKLIHTVNCENICAKVYRDAEWNEYRTRFYVDGILQPDADAFTDDKADAILSTLTIEYPINRMADIGSMMREYTPPNYRG